MFAGAGGGINLRTQMPGDLDGGLTHTASTGMDEHPLPGPDPPDLDKSNIGGQKRRRYRRGLGKRPPSRDRHHHLMLGDRGRRKSVVGEQPHHRITRA